MTEPSPQTKQRRGCLFYGCMGGLVLLLVIVIAGLIGLRFAKKMFNEFTDSQPVDLPAVKLSQPEIEALRKRVDAFSEAVNTGKHTAPLTLTGDEINALFTTEKDLKSLHSRFYVTLENDQLKGQLSIPLEDLGLHIFKGRYLNGSGTFSISFRNGVLYVNPQNITVKGKPLPDTYMQNVRKQNLARDANSDPETSKDLQKIQSIEIKDNQLIVTPKETTKPKEKSQ